MSNRLKQDMRRSERLRRKSTGRGRKLKTKEQHREGDDPKKKIEKGQPELTRDRQNVFAVRLRSNES